MHWDRRTWQANVCLADLVSEGIVSRCVVNAASRDTTCKWSEDMPCFMNLSSLVNLDHKIWEAWYDSGWVRVAYNLQGDRITYPINSTSHSVLELESDHFNSIGRVHDYIRAGLNTAKCESNCHGRGLAVYLVVYQSVASQVAVAYRSRWQWVRVNV